MNYSCLHTHTNFCDGMDSVEAMCDAAWEQGLSILGFSAHAPLPEASGIVTNWHLPWDRLEAYVETVQNAQKTWAGKLHILLGLEIDYISGVCGPADHRFDSYDLDYRIGSVHYLANQDVSSYFTVDGPTAEWQDGVKRLFSGDYEAAAHEYWQAVAEMVHQGSFDILGHIDLVKKNHSPWWNNQTPEGYNRDFLQVLRALRGTSIVVEVNTGALNRGSLNETYPSEAVLKAMRPLSIPVTINADAHNRAHLRGYYDRAIDVLKASGYEEIVNFWGKNKDPLTKVAGPIGWVAEPLP